MVLGIYYLTHIKPEGLGQGKIFGSLDEAILAHQNGIVDVNVAVKLSYNGQLIETSVGRVLLNDILPESLRFVNEEMVKKDLKGLMSRILEIGRASCRERG